MTGDLKDFYLGTPMQRYEYLRIPVKAIPQSVYKYYALQEYEHDGYVYAEIRKGMYGLPQAGKIASDRLIQFLEPHGYAPVPITPGLWRHQTRPLTFTLVVDDFGVKYINKEDVRHLMDILNQQYRVSEDWTGSRYCGITIEWDYTNRTCDISMPGYIERALQRFNHPLPRRHQFAPHPWNKPNYGAKIQYATPEDVTPVVSSSDKTRIQEILGTLLFYA
jgi:hypothetical protein